MVWVSILHCRHASVCTPAFIAVEVDMVQDPHTSREFKPLDKQTLDDGEAHHQEETT
jgi:hypothetical protein